jgi:hypothetical protein
MVALWEMEGQGKGFLGDAKGTGGNALRVDAFECLGYKA